MILKCFTSVAAVALLCNTAFAADLPATRPPSSYIPPIPGYSWTGFYAGAQVGYEFGTSQAVTTSTVTGGVLDSVNGTKNGVIGGIHGGYLYSTPFLGVGTAAVIGIEADVDGASGKANYALPVAGELDSVREGIQGSVRGRFGVAFDRVLVYGTGGFAVGGIDVAEFATSDQFSHVKAGYTFGGGVEYAYTNSISFRAEYRYTNYGTITDNLANSTSGLVNLTHRESNNRIQGGISVKLDPDVTPPVVARY